MPKADWVYFNGEMIPWEKAQVHMMTHSLHYGLAAFEGIRAYKLADGGVGVFRLREHMKRLLQSADMVLIDAPTDVDTLVDATLELIKKNNFTEGCYVRPLIFLGEGAMGISANDNPVHVSIMAWEWGAYLGEDGLKNGIRTRISTFRRPRADTWLPKAKITGQYVNSIMAKREALRSGYDEAIMLDTEGLVSEGTGENIFVVHGDVIRTPPLGSSILAGITRETVLKIFKSMGKEAQELPIGRDELYMADEIFLTGTAAEVTPVREMDDRSVGTGKPGPITQLIQKRYAEITAGMDEEFMPYIERVKFN